MKLWCERKKTFRQNTVNTLRFYEAKTKSLCKKRSIIYNIITFNSQQTVLSLFTMEGEDTWCLQSFMVSKSLLGLSCTRAIFVYKSKQKLVVNLYNKLVELCDLG